MKLNNFNSNLIKELQIWLDKKINNKLKKKECCFHLYGNNGIGKSEFIKTFFNNDKYKLKIIGMEDITNNIALNNNVKDIVCYPDPICFIQGTQQILLIDNFDLIINLDNIQYKDSLQILKNNRYKTPVIIITDNYIKNKNLKSFLNYCYSYKMQNPTLEELKYACKFYNKNIPNYKLNKINSYSELKQQFNFPFQQNKDNYGDTYKDIFNLLLTTKKLNLQKSFKLYEFESGMLPFLFLEKLSDNYKFKEYSSSYLPEIKYFNKIIYNHNTSYLKYILTCANCIKLPRKKTTSKVNYPQILTNHTNWTSRDKKTNLITKTDIYSVSLNPKLLENYSKEQQIQLKQFIK